MSDAISDTLYKMNETFSTLQTSNNVVSGSADQHASVTDAWNVNYSESDVVESVYLTPNQIQELEDQEAFKKPLHVDLLNTWDLLLKSSHAGLDTDVMTIGTDEHIADDKNLQPVTEKVWHSTFKQNFNTHVYTASTHAGTADMSTESFIFIEKEKDNPPVEKESFICDRNANIKEMYCNEITTFRKRNASMYFSEELEFIRERSGNDDKPVRKNCRKLCIVKERQYLWQLLHIVMLLLNMESASATRSIDLKPKENYIVFQNDTPAIFYCYGNGFGTGAVVSWSLNGTGYGTEHAQMGITYVIDPPTGDTVSSHLIVPSNSTINNNTQVVCRAADVTFSNVLTSLPSNLTIQGPLQPPTNFYVIVSNTSNTTFLLSWGAPFSLNVTDSPDISYYTLCTNITMYGCRNIPSDPDCIFSGTNQCNSSVDFTDHSLNGTNGEKNNTIMDYGDPIHFTFFAVNGAGNGTKANFTYLFKKESDTNLAPSQTEPRSTNIVPTMTTLLRNRQSENLILEVAIPVVFIFVIVVLLVIVLMVLVIKRLGTKRTSSEPPVDVELYSYATPQEKTTVTAKNQTKAESHYTDVACHPIISIPAPHHNVQYSEVKPQNETPKPDPNGYMDVECHPIISIPAPHDEVQYSEAIQHPHRVKCDSEDNGNESKPDPNGYMDVECHPIISIPAPHDEVQYSEKPDPNGYMDVECHPIISIPAPHDEVQYSEAIQHPHWVEYDSEDNGNQSDSRWCHPSDPAQQATTDHIAPVVDLAAKHADVSKCKSIQRKLSELTEHHWTLSSDLSDIKPFMQEPYYNPCEGIDYIRTGEFQWKVASSVFVFASTITPQCTILSPTVLVHETMEVECSSDISHILKDDQSNTDSDELDVCAYVKSAGPIIIEATAAFVKNGHPWIWAMSLIQKITIKATVNIPWLKGLTVFCLLAGKVLTCSGFIKDVHNFSCAAVDLCNYAVT